MERAQKPPEDNDTDSFKVVYCFKPISACMIGRIVFLEKYTFNKENELETTRKINKNLLSWSFEALIESPQRRTGITQKWTG